MTHFIDCFVCSWAAAGRGVLWSSVPKHLAFYENVVAVPNLTHLNAVFQDPATAYDVQLANVQFDGRAADADKPAHPGTGACGCCLGTRRAPNPPAGVYGMSCDVEQDAHIALAERLGCCDHWVDLEIALGCCHPEGVDLAMLGDDKTATGTSQSQSLPCFRQDVGVLPHLEELTLDMTSSLVDGLAHLDTMPKLRRLQLDGSIFIYSYLKQQAAQELSALT